MDEHSRRDSPAAKHLTLHPMIWVMLCIVLLMVMRVHMQRAGRPKSLDFESGDRIHVVRESSSRHNFVDLGISTQLPSGWSLLSVTDDANADPVTLLHTTDQLIIRFQPWDVSLQKHGLGPKPMDTKKQSEEVNQDPSSTTPERPSRNNDSRRQSRVQWFDLELEGEFNSIPAEQKSETVQHEPISLSNRHLRAIRMGHWSSGETELLVLLFDVQLRDQVPPSVSELIESVEPFKP